MPVGDKTLMDFFLGITNKCNLSCPWCAHKRLRDLEPNYEMSQREFEKWYQYTKSAGYTFESIDFNGLGEPTCYSDVDFFKYMIIRSRRFTDNVNILTNGINVSVLEKIMLFVDNVTISVWNETTEMSELQNKYPKKVHLRKDIEKHDVSSAYTEFKSERITTCGCSGCGYTMNTVFLVCGTWCPQINKNGLYHTDLKEEYLHTLDEQYGTTAYEMCKRCHANVSIQYRLYGEKEWRYNTTL